MKIVLKTNNQVELGWAQLVLSEAGIWAMRTLPRPNSRWLPPVPL